MEIFKPTENIFLYISATVLSPRDSGWYSCGAVSESGSVMARSEIDVSKEVDRPPPIIQLGPVNQTLPIRTSASLPCQASGDETISWLKDGVPLTTLVDRRYQVDSDNTLSIKSKSIVVYLESKTHKIGCLLLTYVCSYLGSYLFLILIF